MTVKAPITAAELRRMAKVAKSEGVDVWIEIDGKRYGVSPAVHSVQADEVPPEEFKSLAEWKVWREQERAREKATRKRRTRTE